jgi:hypothetical protein
MKLELGETYRRDEIHRIVGGGSRQSYLPQRNGKILCGCFDNKLNKRAPLEIDAGDGPIVISGAKLFASGKNAVPVFLKRKGNAWEYVGDFRCTGCSTDKKDLYPNVEGRRRNAILVFYLERVFSDSERQAPADLFSQEGGKILRTHFIRERDPSLVAAKKNTFIAQHGQLFCAVCGLEERSLPAQLGYSCFEVHHILSIGQRSEEVPTRLSDLVIVCANCHRMIHSTSEPLLIEELQKRIEKCLVGQRSNAAKV